MTQGPKKSARDLSDLKAKLGMKKGGAGAAPAAQPGAPAPAQVPPPGAPPPGAPVQQQPAQPAQPDVRRDPFAAQQPMMAPQQPQVISDAGPLLDIPEEKKSPVKLIIILVITALIPLVVGWACGRIYASRLLFNATIDDAGRIREQVNKMKGVNDKLAAVFAESRARNKNKVKWDKQLIEDLKDVLRSAPLANQEKARKEQDKLFRTNYAMMEDIAINRLFQYFNNSIRLFAEIESFIQKTDRAKDMIKAYEKESGEQERKYGVVFAEDAGRYYLGQLVQVGNIVCADENAKECRKDQIQGFMVRTGMSGSWSPRIGKPMTKNQRITEIVIPIIPDKNWQSVASCKRGYMAFQEYRRGYLTISAITSLLDRDVKTLLQDLGKAAGREKLFAPI